jgi:16S rRNA (guanine1516-N2)-methyltransferase
VAIDGYYNMGKSAYRLAKQCTQKEILFKALGQIKTGEQERTTRVLDGTMGLAQDCALAAARGYDVVALEENEMIFSLVEDALLRLRKSLDEDAEALSTPQKNILKNLKILNQSFLLPLPQQLQNFDVIYLDPMFPESGKSALPQKSMQILKSLLGLGQSAETRGESYFQSLLEYGLRLLDWNVKGTGRLVFKRPLEAPVLNPAPTSQVRGKMIRFDIYVR